MRKRPSRTIYRAADGWRWRLRASNGRIIADSGEAYSSRRAAQTGYDLVKATFRTATILLRDIP